MYQLSSKSHGGRSSRITTTGFTAISKNIHERNDIRSTAVKEFYFTNIFHGSDGSYQCLTFSPFRNQPVSSFIINLTWKRGEVKPSSTLSLWSHVCVLIVVC
jgi:hypothetical protein